MLSETARLAARRFGPRPAFATAAGWSISFEELDRAADEAAAGLSASGIGEGAVVALVTGSTPDHVVLYLALSRLGAVTAGTNPRLGAHETSSCLATLAPDLVIVSADRADRVDPAHRKEVLEPGNSAASVAGGLRVRGGRAPEADPDDSRPVCVCFTSGTTGHPRGAWFTGRQLRAVAEIDSGGAWGGGGHGIASTQLAHVGFMTKLPWLLASGQTTHLLERWSAETVLELVAGHRMQAITGVAPQIALLVRHPLARELDFASVRAVVAGGAPSPPRLVAEARRTFGAPYSIRYSSTESGGVGLATALDAPDEEALHTVGRARPGVQVQIRDDGGTRVPDGEVGELWLRAPTMMSGYWRDDAATAATLVDGWLRTGDLALVDATGCIRLADRLSDVFIRGGYNVHPAEVEAVLADHPQVAEVVVVARPHDVLGEIGEAVVVPADPAAPPSLDSLRELGGHRLADFKLPESLRLVDEIPRTSADKVDRAAL